jgi:hypothetical protein
MEPKKGKQKHCLKFRQCFFCENFLTKEYREIFDSKDIFNLSTEQNYFIFVICSVGLLNLTKKVLLTIINITVHEANIKILFAIIVTLMFMTGWLIIT